MKRSVTMFVLGVVCVAAAVVGSRRGAVVNGQSPQAQNSHGSFVVKNARVFDGERVLERATVVVRDGRIAQVGPDVAVPVGVEVVDGSGRTLLPGLIDAHTHSFGDALERALVFGATTVFDMFTDHTQAAQWRKEQQATGAPRRADIFSAGTLVTAPKGHGTQFGMPIPTITSAADAQSFVDARLAEGSDYIKIVYEEGSAYGMSFPSIDDDVLRAVIAAAKARGKLAVVHVGSHAAAETAIAAGADGLVHIFGDQEARAGFAQKVRSAGAFVIPTFTVLESVAGNAGGAAVGRHQELAPFVTPAERSGLGSTFPQRAGNRVRIAHALATVRQLHAAGVPILAGSDAPNPGTAHGLSIHRELELLVQAGLTPLEALRAATARSAAAFRLSDRGRIAPGLHADLILVAGEPDRDIKATRSIVNVWKRGVRLERQPAATEEQLAQAVSQGRISDFESGEPTAAFGVGWQISTDTMLGGSSEAALRIVKPGANGSSAALEITGTIKPGAPFPWAGAMFFPATPPMSPANLSKFKELVFWARGDGREYQVMMFATRFGNMPVSQPFTPTAAWKEYVIPLASFSNMDGSDLRGILFSANSTQGSFTFAIDSVMLR